MEEDLFELNKVVNQDIVDIIDKYGLKSKSRRRDIVYKRYYLYHVLRVRRHCTLNMTGKYFDRDHSTVCVGLEKHNFWWSIKDKSYLQSIYPLPDILNNNHNLELDDFIVDCFYIDEEQSKITITGNFKWSDLEKLPNIITRDELIKIFKDGKKERNIHADYARK